MGLGILPDHQGGAELAGTRERFGHQPEVRGEYLSGTLDDQLQHLRTGAPESRLLVTSALAVSHCSRLRPSS